MQPSQFEIQREVENLRDIRRRSSIQGGPGVLIIDPDLPEQSPLPREDWAGSPVSPDDLVSSSSHDDSEDSIMTPADDPSSLFWVPARLHPEIAPSEFRNFLKEHTRVNAEGGLSRSSSSSSTYSYNGGLGRKKSMLRNQYDPSKKTDSDDENVIPLRRNRTSYNNVPQLTISDLQRLEELAEEASQSDDPSKLRSVLRRSLSMNVSPSVIDKMDDMPMGDDVDSPIIVPPPGQILRRAARTKIRKAGQTMEGAHRFSSRRGRGSTGSDTEVPNRRRSDVSSSDHSDGHAPPPRRPSLHHTDSEGIVGPVPQVPPVPSITPYPRPESFSNEPTRPMSFSEESSIYDSYVRDDGDEDYTSPVTSPPPSAIPAVTPPADEHEFGVLPPVLAPAPVPVQPTPTLHHPQPQRLAAPQPDSPGPSRTPSPDAPSVTSSLDVVPHLPRASQPEQPVPYSAKSPPPTAQARKEKEKEKKGGFFKWGKGKEKEKEKDSGFLGSIFGGGKKKNEEQAGPAIGTGAGRETAAALLGASKSSRNYQPSPSPQPVNGNYARYPIHVERAIYRLSHIKLANPRRPLYEQVLISNLMFWYLGVINKSQSQSQLPQNQQQQGQGQNAGGDAAQQQPESAADKEKEQREREEREKAAERERQEKEREQREREKERERQAEQKREPRRGPLTKAPPPGTPANRRAEMPIRGPQYERQQRAMEYEHGYGQSSGNSASMPQPPVRSPSAPPGPGGQGHRSGSSQRTAHSGPPPLNVGQPQHGGSNNYYYDGHDQRRTPQPSGLPPGAMPPAGMDQSWMQQSPQSPSVPRTPPSPANGPGNQNYVRTSHSPPPVAQPHQGRHGHHGGQQGYTNGGGKSPSRSQSATAVPPSSVNGGSFNGKGRSQSAHATAPSPGGYGRQRSASNADPNKPTSPEEDVPLAMWQQQQASRRR